MPGLVSFLCLWLSVSAEQTKGFLGLRVQHGQSCIPLNSCTWKLAVKPAPVPVEIEGCSVSAEELRG